MSITTVSGREFARDLAHAKRATTRGPVFVTDRGKPTYALLKIEDYYKLTGEKPKSLLDVMNSLPGGDFEFEPPRLESMGIKAAGPDGCLCLTQTRSRNCGPVSRCLLTLCVTGQAKFQPISSTWRL